MILMSIFTGFLNICCLIILVPLGNLTTLPTNSNLSLSLSSSHSSTSFQPSFSHPTKYSRTLQATSLIAQNQIQSTAKITIGSAKKSILQYSDKVNGFQNLPNEKELAEMAKAVDVFVIAKTVKILIEKEDINCEKKLVYLSELRALILNQISSHKSSLAEQEIIQRNAQQQLKRLLIQLSLELQRLEQLGISSYEQKMNIQISSLQYIYDLHHQINLQIQISTHTKQKIQARIERKESEFQQLDNAKNALQVEWRQNEEEKQRRIAIFQSQILIKQEEVAKEKNDFFFNEAYLNRKIIQATRLKRIYLKLQIQIQRTRTMLFQLKKEDMKIRSSINQINKDLQVHRQRANSGIAEALQEQMHKLQASLKQIQQQFAVLHYYCFQLNFDENGTQYEYNIDKFRGLVQDIYQLDPKKIQTIEDIEDVYIMPIDIFSSKWKQQYQPVSEEHIVIVNVGVDENGPLQYSFTCIQPFSIITQQKKTENSFESCIVVEDENGIKYNAYAGLCTRLRNVNKNTLVGQRIFWKGNKLERAVSVKTGQCI